MSESPGLSNMTLIGIDGGATEVKAHAVGCVDPTNMDALRLTEVQASRVYHEVAGFVPIPVAEQIAQRDAGTVTLTREERAQGESWVRATSDAVCEIVGDARGSVLIGIGMPGLKTQDARGIEVINNGPRIPDYLQQLEHHLAANGIKLAAPVARLGSDADYCGIGERFGEGGLFRGVDNVYYVGCGTGIADAMLLYGRLVPFDDATDWIQKSWQMSSSLGPTFEKLISANAINQCYARLLGCEDTGAVRFPEIEAVDGFPPAQAWMQMVALLMAELMFDRLMTVRGGKNCLPHRDAAHAALNADHAYRGTILERVVIGQRLGLILGDKELGATLHRQLSECLAAMINECGDSEVKASLLCGGNLVEGFIQPSRLRAAPALGAAIAAARAYVAVS